MSKASVAQYSLSKNLIETGGLTPEEEVRVQEKIKALSEILMQVPKAQYKLEVLFSEQRSMFNPFPGAVTFWDNGDRMHGGGDSKLYMCPGKMVGKNDCEGFIRDSAHGGNFMVCMSCQSRWKINEGIGEVFYRLTIQNWGAVLTRWFLRLGMDADIRIKYARDDIRHAARLEQERQRGGELLAKVRDTNRRTTAIYRKDAIIRDVNAGAEIGSRILAFLKA